MSLQRFKALSIIALLFCKLTYANSFICNDLSLEVDHLQNQIWSGLKADNQLVNQSDLTVPGENKLCGAACAINILNASAKMLGLKMRTKPVDQFFNFVRERVNYQKGMNFDEITKGINYLFQKHLNIKPHFRGIVLDGKKISNLFSSELLIEPIHLYTPKKGLKMAIVELMDNQDRPMGAHAVVIEDFDGSKLSMIDPNDPLNTWEASLSGSYSDGKRTSPYFEYNKADSGPTDVQGFFVRGILSIVIP